MEAAAFPWITSPVYKTDHPRSADHTVGRVIKCSNGGVKFVVLQYDYMN